MTGPASPPASATRKLAAIVFADVVGYTAQMGRDEKAALELVAELRKRLYPLAERHRAGIVKELGDGALLSFDSVIDALECSAALQRATREVSGLRLRIGVHIGDVVIEERDVFGTGVNVAARVQPLALPGGVVVTEDVFKQAEGHPELRFAPLGRRRLKGVAAPVRVFALAGEGLAVPHPLARMASRPGLRRVSALAGAALLVGAVGLTTLGRRWRAAEVPSLAVLKLENLGPEADEVYSYGITQDLIVDLAKAGRIRVAPMKDVLSLPGGLSLRETARVLRVEYVMEGSLRREGTVLRLSAQVVRVASGRAVWADRLETPVVDAWSLQGRLARTLLSALDVRPGARLVRGITGAKTTHPEAYELYLRGKHLFEGKASKEDVVVARGLFERAARLDPSLVSARRGLAQTHRIEGDYGRAREILQSALAVAEKKGQDLETASCLVELGHVLQEAGDYAPAVEHHRRALALARELGDRETETRSLGNLGIVAEYQGKLPEALEFYAESLEVHRDLGDRRREGIALNNLAGAHLARGDPVTALGEFTRSLELAREVGDRELEGAVVGNIGSIHEGRGNYPAALEEFRRSLEIARALGDRIGEAIALLNMGKVEERTGELSSALVRGREGLAILREVGDRRTEGLGLEILARTLLALGDHAGAHAEIERGLALAGEIGDRALETQLVSVRGMLEIERGAYGRAETDLARAAGRAEELALPVMQGEALLGLGRLRLARGEAAKAEPDLDASARLSEGALDDAGLARTFALRALVRARMGKAPAAREDLGRARDLLRSNAALRTPLALWRLSQASLLIGEARDGERDRAEAQALVRAWAGRIQDAGARERFLAKVPHNREILGAQATTATKP